MQHSAVRPDERVRCLSRRRGTSASRPGLRHVGLAHHGGRPTVRTVGRGDTFAVQSLGDLGEGLAFRFFFFGHARFAITSWAFIKARRRSSVGMGVSASRISTASVGARVEDGVGDRAQENRVYGYRGVARVQRQATSADGRRLMRGGSRERRGSRGGHIADPARRSALTRQPTSPRAHGRRLTYLRTWRTHVPRVPDTSTRGYRRWQSSHMRCTLLDLHA